MPRIALIFIISFCFNSLFASPILLGSMGDYHVKKGDNLGKTAKQHHLAGPKGIKCIAKLNNIKNINHIYIGQSLFIPTKTQCSHFKQHLHDQ